MNQADIARRLARAWPGIAGVLDSRLSPALRRRPRTYDDRRAFEALLLYVWKGLPVRDSLGGKFPTGGVLHRRWRLWRDAEALKPMVGAYARALPRADLKAWRERLAGYDRQVLCGKNRNPATGWLMVNRFWHDAVAVPFIEAGRRSGKCAGGAGRH